MKPRKKKRFGDITIHKNAFVGSVLRGRDPIRRESYGGHVLRMSAAFIKSAGMIILFPFAKLAEGIGALARSAAKLRGLSQKSVKTASVISPLYVPAPKIIDVTEERKRAERRWPRVAALCAAVLPIAVLIATMSIEREPSAVSVFLSDGRETTEFLTTADTVDEFVGNNILLDSGDVLLTQRDEPIEPGMSIYIKRAFPVLVSSMEKTAVLNMSGGNVKDALELAGISYSHEDIVSPGLDSTLAPGMRISHVTIDTLEEVKSVEVPFKKVTVKESSLEQGKTKLKTEGKNGVKEITERVVLHDNVEVERTVVSEKVVAKPVNQVTLQGTGSPYVKVKKETQLQNDKRAEKAPPKQSQIKTTLVVEATAYTHTGNKTATGTVPKVGTIAVDPDLIPYGTKLYVEGYGYGRAEDTGAFRKNDSKKQIDLFMDTVRECVKWGRKRNVKIYILK